VDVMNASLLNFNDRDAENIRICYSWIAYVFHVDMTSISPDQRFGVELPASFVSDWKSYGTNEVERCHRADQLPY
jgi:hypothetical protein